MLVKVPELQKQVAVAVRASLAKETDPARLKDNYGFLWGLEFRTTSPKEFPALRQQVAADVQRLESLHNPHPDADWASLLLQGSQQAGAAPDIIRAREDAILTRYPHSRSANSITWKRWKDAHPEPTDNKDIAAWQRYNAKGRAVQIKWLEQFPDENNPPDFYRLDILRSDDSLTEQQGVELAEKAVRAANTYFPPGMRMWGAHQPGTYLLDHKWAPDQALAYLLKAKQWQDRGDAEYLAGDDHSDADLKDHAKSTTGMERYLDGRILSAAMRAYRPEAIDSALKASVEAPRADDDKDESSYWWRRALLATLEGRKQDAIGYYQIALRTRTKPPSYQQGKLQDDLTDEAHALWIERGGTETAWAPWSQPAAKDTVKADDARWEKPSKALPEFSLADLSGKTWTTKSLNGKVVLINLWATWCGPCNAELPQLQKLYDQAKGRSDVQILTFNIDEDLGLVEPFLKEKGYTFPVLPAYSYVVSLLDGYAIPQNWLLNPKGEWQWTQLGYGSDDAWVKDMLAKLDAMKSGT
jgi:thiol-disulfide isomerase/thioredoxin